MLCSQAEGPVPGSCPSVLAQAVRALVWKRCHLSLGNAVNIGLHVQNGTGMHWPSGAGLRGPVCTLGAQSNF